VVERVTGAGFPGLNNPAGGPIRAGGKMPFAADPGRKLYLVFDDTGIPLYIVPG